MSEATDPVRLDLLAGMIRRLQADMRSMRDETKLNQRLLKLRTERVATHEAYTASRIDQLAEVTFTIADKLGSIGDEHLGHPARYCRPTRGWPPS